MHILRDSYATAISQRFISPDWLPHYVCGRLIQLRTYVRTYVNLGNLTYLCFEAASKIHQHGNTMKLHKERANRIQQGTPQLYMTKQCTYVRLSILCFFFNILQRYHRVSGCRFKNYVRTYMLHEDQVRLFACSSFGH